MNDAQTGIEVLEHRRQKSLGHDVRQLLSRRNVMNADVAECHFLPNKVNVELNMLGVPMVNWILRHVHSRDVVAVDDRRRVNRDMKFAKEMTKPATFSCGICDAPVFCLGTGPGDNGLAL